MRVKSEGRRSSGRCQGGIRQGRGVAAYALRMLCPKRAYNKYRPCLAEGGATCCLVAHRMLSWRVRSCRGGSCSKGLRSSTCCGRCCASAEPGWDEIWGGQATPAHTTLLQVCMENQCKACPSLQCLK